MSQIACCGGFLDKGSPLGEEAKIAGIDCYVTNQSPSNKEESVVILATDVFGYKLPNARLIADAFSKELGVKCIIPDLFQG